MNHRFDGIEVRVGEDPASLKFSTLGGNIAECAGGMCAVKYGVTRDYVLGLEVVLADGAVLRLGGRTHKNKTGFELHRLFVGSEGLLGVVTEATVRSNRAVRPKTSISPRLGRFTF